MPAPEERSKSIDLGAPPPLDSEKHQENFENFGKYLKWLDSLHMTDFERKSYERVKKKTGVG